MKENICFENNIFNRNKGSSLHFTELVLGQRRREVDRGWASRNGPGKEFILPMKEMHSYLSTTDVLKGYVELEICSQEIRASGAENSPEEQCKTP